MELVGFVVDVGAVLHKVLRDSEIIGVYRGKQACGPTDAFHADVSFAFLDKKPD
jgi:hypothetical protein